MSVYNRADIKKKTMKTDDLNAQYFVYLYKMSWEVLTPFLISGMVYYWYFSSLHI